MFDFIGKLFGKAEDTTAISAAEQKAKDILLAAQEAALKIRQEADRDARRITGDAVEAEKQLARTRSQIGQEKAEVQRERSEIERLKAGFKEREQSLTTKQTEISEIRDQMLVKLEKIAQLTKDEAKSLLLQGWEDKLKGDYARKIKQSEEDLKTEIDTKAKELLVDAMKFGATDFVPEYTLSVVPLPSDDYKGRIIGKDGRNIRAFELATGVDCDLEEEGVIKLSSFDGVRREVARIALDRLIRDGRIQPPRIEEIVNKTRSEVEKVMFKAGEDLCHRVGAFNLHPDLVALLGRFKYRFSYGQNLILHTLEETRIGMAIAAELKLDVNAVRLGCLLHDIGKVAPDAEGSNHVDLGVEIAKKYKMPEIVIGCIAAHHEDVAFPSLEAAVVYIGDAISGSRPGARHEDFEAYSKRITKIEDIAKSKKGVKEVYALQAGRELRVLVTPKEVSDDDAVILGKTIKEELEKAFDVFPGQIKITIIRESRTETVTRI